MRWTRRASQPSRPWCVDPAVFDTAAQELGFTLDPPQRRAAHDLATAERSLYLWGPVGRGKSWLMATYFAALPTERKLRLHFHEFFRDLHLAIRRRRGDLAGALDELLDGVDVVCFDEFHVHDPADGRFIARLLPTLLDRGIRLVLTSNHPPHALLPNPLFHHDFVPTIELIERSLVIVTVDGPVDYRTVSGHETGFAAGRWVSPGTAEQLAWLGLRPPTADERVTLAPAGHPVPARRATDECLWVDFADLCESATAPADYLGLARDHPRWVIDGVPDLRSAGRDAGQRFANVVDVLYDRDIAAVFLAAVPSHALATVPPHELAAGARLPLDIDRITSRLGQLGRIESVVVER